MNKLQINSSNEIVSIVVIGRNEGERLLRCLTSVRSTVLLGKELELIYVDSGSVDGSVTVAQSLGVKTIELHPERPSAALGRNAGWKIAQGSFVLFLDGDTLLEPSFLANALPIFDDPEVAVVWGHRRELFPEKSCYNRVLDLDWIYPPGPAAFCGGDALFRRTALLSTGGFDEQLIAGEEPELCQRIQALGGVILHVDLPMTGHDLDLTSFRQYWKRCSRAGHAYAEIADRFRGTPGRFWGDECARNRNRVAALIALALVSCTAMLFHNPSALAIALALSAGLVLRSAWKARWKSPRVWTLLLYGIHSHFQQLPIFAGQLRYSLNRRRGRRTMLLEYKNL